MSCPRASETDFAAFAADRDAAEWRELRAHYPGCPDCAREVAVWTRMGEALRGGGEPASHLEEADLLAFAEAPGTLTSARRREIEAHLEGCAPCRTEMAVLRGFDLAALRAPEVAPAPSLGARLGDWLTGWLAPLGQPAWALAALVLLAIPVGLAIWRGFGDAPTPPPIAQEEPAPPTPEAPLPDGEAAPQQLAQESLAPEVPELDEGTGIPTPGVTAEPEPVSPADVVAESRTPAEPEVVAEATTPEPDTRSTPEASPPPIVAETRPSLPPTPPVPSVPDEPLDLDTLLAADPPAYRPQLALAGGSLESLRTASAIRGADDGLPRVTPMLPEHVGATRSATPTLYWHLDARATVPVELTLIAEDGVEPLLERRIDAPVAAGPHALDLKALGVTLAAGKTYLFHTALVPDQQRRDLDVLATAAVRYTPASPDLTRRLEAGGPAARPSLLAEAGYWIDAFDAVSRIAAAHPESKRAASWRAALLDQVGQGALAAAPVR